MKAAWLTDIHLDFLDESAFESFMQTVRYESADVVLISGDIALAPTIKYYLWRMSQILTIPIYFVLGNHDFYKGSIADVRADVAGLSEQISYLHYLNTCGVVHLNPRFSLVGHDGWSDGQLGDFDNSTVLLNDFVLISELSGLSRYDRLEKIKQLGAEAAAHFKRVLPEALEQAEQVIVLTHVPPYREATWYNGRHCDDSWLPFFSCKAVGDVLSQVMAERPDRKMTVLCGHTHGGGVSQILPNLLTITGTAQYGHPVIQTIFDWE